MRRAGGYLGERANEGIASLFSGLEKGTGMGEIGGTQPVDPTEVALGVRGVGRTTGELLTPDPLMVAGVGAGAGKVGQVIRSIGKDVVMGTGKGLENAGKILSRAKAGVSGDLTNTPPTAAKAGLTRRGIESPGATSGMRAPDDPLTAIDREKMGRQLSTGAVIRPYEEGGPTIIKSTPKSTPEPKAAHTGRPGEIIDPFRRDYEDLKVTTGKGPTMGSTPLPTGELRTAKQLSGEAGSRRVRATPHAAPDPQPSIAARQRDRKSVGRERV